MDMDKFYPYNSLGYDRVHDADDLARILRALITDGVAMASATQMQVLAAGNFNVTVKAGTVMVQGRVGMNESDKTFTIAAPNAGADRIDRIVSRADYANRKSMLLYLQGTPASSPSPPALKDDADGYDIKLARIYVSKTAAMITQAAITDERVTCGLVVPNHLEAWLAQTKSGIDQTVETMETDLAAWIQGQQLGFSTWFASIQNTLGSDVAGNLLNLINRYKSRQANVTLAVSDWVASGSVYVATKAVGIVPEHCTLHAGASMGKRFRLQRCWREGVGGSRREHYVYGTIAPHCFAYGWYCHIGGGRMSIVILNHGAGSKKELAVKVQGGTVQPTGKAGLVWINTAAAISKVTWAAPQPASPAIGDVWVQTDAASPNVISMLALTAVVVRVNVFVVKQWNGSAWIARNASYHNGTGWTVISSEVLIPATGIHYTGTYTLIDDGSGHWRVKFLTSGILTVDGTATIDALLVGGGAGGGNTGNESGGGGGGYTTTAPSIAIASGVQYPIVVGAGGNAGTDGGASAAFGATAHGGYSTTSLYGGYGGSGGGAGHNTTGVAGDGGSNGGNGGNSASGGGGVGQGTTTREFGEASGTLYSGGGGGGGSADTGTGGAGGGGNGANYAGANATSGTVNTGGGGGGKAYQKTAGTGGSGIVVIRDHR